MPYAMSKTTVVPAIMPQSEDELVQLLNLFGNAASAIQIDVMDGKFVPSVSWPYKHAAQFAELESMAEEQSLSKHGAGDIEVHLMVSAPGEVGELFARAGASRVIGHIESFVDAEHARVTASSWRAAGAREVGVSLLLATPIERILPLIERSDVDVVQVMSIAPIGAQGHAFEARALNRIRELRAKSPNIRIAVDGGVNLDNASSIIAAGADQLAVGSAILASDDPLQMMQELQQVG